MRTRTFGRTGLEVSEVVFGGGKVGGLLIDADDDTKLATVRRALQAGVNWIDTAAMYGQGRSEQALGWILREVEETPTLSTKVRLDITRLDDIPGQIERSMAESLERLGRDSVDLLQLHNPIDSEPGRDTVGLDHVLGDKGAAEGLERVRDQGLTRFIGLTALGDASLCRAAIESGRFDSAQVYYNLLNPSAGRAMPAAWRGHDFGGLVAACRAQGTAVMAIRILGAGVIATDLRHGRESVITWDAEVPVEEARARAVFEALEIDEAGLTPWGTRAQTALRFVLAHPDIACAVYGLAEPAHLEEALAAAEADPLPDAALAALDEVYASNFGLDTGSS